MTVQTTVQQDLFNRAVVADKHIPSALNGSVSPLVSWAAFQVGTARIGVGIVEKLGTMSDWQELQITLGIDNHGVTEAGAISLTAAAVATSIDLSASAALRLAGATPGRHDREFDMGTFSNKQGAKLLQSHPLTAQLDQWRLQVEASSDWQFLKECRDQLIHRTTNRTIFMNTDPDHVPSSAVHVNGQQHPVSTLVHQFAAFGESTFNAFCDALIADFPKP